MKDYVMPIILAIIGGGAFGFIEFLIKRKDTKQTDKIDKLNKSIESLQRSQCRTEMLVMMNHYPNEQMEIMRLAKVYFCDMKGDFYLTSLFSKWLKENNIDVPIWFNDGK